MTDQELAKLLSDWKDDIIKLTSKIIKGAGQLDIARQSFEDQKKSKFERFMQILPYLLIIILPIVFMICVSIFSRWVTWCKIDIPNYVTILRDSKCK